MKIGKPLNDQKKMICAVPTNIVTGFLGVGKTTVILNLLKQKPAGERWAVLVNEFGEIGIDGALIQGRHSEQKGIYIREVPGGCMCCAAGLPMHIALNQLLAKAKPDRLIIEPTGLGHPQEVLEVLSAEHYKTVLNIQQCITLVDARNVMVNRYTSHDTFNQQIDIADIIIGHKADLYDDDTQNNLRDYLAQRGKSTVPIYFVANGQLDIALLQGASASAHELSQHKTLQRNTTQQHHHGKPAVVDVNERDIPACGYLKVSNTGERFRSLGWRFAPDKIFDRDALNTWFLELNVERAKGVFITRDGVFGYNMTADTFMHEPLDDCLESRVEIISQQEDPQLEAALLRCIAAQ